jgi:adenylate kinase
MLRDAQRAGTPLGREAERYMAEGKLVPDEIVIGIVEQRLRSADCSRGFILDGFPRTVAQARALDTMLARRDTKLDAVIAVDVPRAELVERLAGRLVCGTCGAMYHRTFDPPTRPGVCDRCGATLAQRDDDREDRIERRLDELAKEVAPVAAYYRTAGLLRPIDGLGTRDAVFGRILEGLAA